MSVLYINNVVCFFHSQKNANHRQHLHEIKEQKLQFAQTNNGQIQPTQQADTKPDAHRDSIKHVVYSINTEYDEIVSIFRSRSYFLLMSYQGSLPWMFLTVSFQVQLLWRCY